MDLVTGAMASLGPKLLQLLQDEYKLQKGFRKQVEFLSVELESIHAALCKVADVPPDQLDEQVRIWAREVREASYDMEDILDTFLVRVEGREPSDPSRLKSAMNKMGSLFNKAKARRDIASAIEEIKKQLQEVAERHTRYRVDEILTNPIATTTAIDPRLAAMYKDVTQLIGIDKSMRDVISIVSSSQVYDVSVKKTVKMVSIVGVGGLGKTTLADRSYKQLKSQYDCGAFVSVGRNPDMVKVFKDILFDLDKYKYENIHNSGRGADLLIREIREFIENKRYFIVIDDIWEPESWETVKLVLVENDCGSGIITTTRNFEVAMEAGEVYKLQPLSYNDSKKLFYTRIFSGNGNCHSSHPDELLNKIIQKCDGLPLAIITMASLLVGKSLEEWSEVYNSIGFGNKGNRHVENTMKILSFSYYDLPSHLSAFPEDYVIDKDLLIWKWIAEGFVHENQGKGLFELGDCCVHDMILDLIRTLAREENFIDILDNIEGTLSISSVRRLAFQISTTSEHITHADRMDMSRVRSYIACRCDIRQWVLLASFKHIRVLALENCHYMEDCNLEHLGNLLHLRYLGLRGTNINELPKKIGNLKFLQTLDVIGTGIKELPEGIVLLTQLMCLFAESHRTRGPDGIGKLSSLEDLRIRHCSDGNSSVMRFVKELGSLRELRVLEATIDVMDQTMLRDLVESLRNLHKIRHLELSVEHDIDTDAVMWEEAGLELPQNLRHLSLLNIRFSKLPSSCINPSRLHILSYLHLRVATMDQEDLKLLGRLTELHCLNLSTESTLTVVRDFDAPDGFFPKLTWFRMAYSMVQFQRNQEESSISLHIWNGTDAMPFGSRRNDGCSGPCAVMPKLEVLTVGVFLRACKDGNGDCSNIGLGCLPSLHKVRVSIDCGRASAADVEEAVAALRNAADAHPNHLALQVHRRNGGDLVASTVKDTEAEGRMWFFEDH
ncbi:unnamed protein product [Urochloa decumbens]|uniref:Uncharacterized protein n=1 Tax=Urochloa decumbens TaxID=240449 RepID=A0ABC9BVD6_9POAL